MLSFLRLLELLYLTARFRRAADGYVSVLIALAATLVNSVYLAVKGAVFEKFHEVWKFDVIIVFSFLITWTEFFACFALALSRARKGVLCVCVMCSADGVISDSRVNFNINESTNERTPLVVARKATGPTLTIPALKVHHETNHRPNKAAGSRKPSAVRWCCLEHQ